MLLYAPPSNAPCQLQKRCAVALLSAGYGLKPGDYAFLANTLIELGYLVVAVQHELPSDPPISTSGDLFTNRLPMWQRGADNLRFVRQSLAQTDSDYDWNQLLLIGHSNGGDISALVLTQNPDFANTLVTLDHRRYPLPRDTQLKVLSIRASDFEADPGVLPQQSAQNGSQCITTIAGSHHNDMNDYGPAPLKAEITQRLLQFLQDGQCGL
ncbi:MULTISPECIES: hypothetical protein [Rheinheimera]|uniref:Alpha/beta hydrolase n=1 Tax=Rheinheimera marina TaxID=1774958 RepID=A0ABV9JNM8_9GAMM